MKRQLARLGRQPVGPCRRSSQVRLVKRPDRCFWKATTGDSVALSQRLKENCSSRKLSINTLAWQKDQRRGMGAISEFHSFDLWMESNTTIVTSKPFSSLSMPPPASPEESPSTRQITTPTTPPDILRIWTQTTDRILQHPVGSLTPNLWKEGHESIMWWLANSDSAESIRLPLKLLDRMFEEEQWIYQRQRKLKKQPAQEATKSLYEVDSIVSDEAKKSVLEGTPFSGANENKGDAERSGTIGVAIGEEDIILPGNTVDATESYELGIDEHLLDVPKFLDTDLLNLIINHWRKVISEDTRMRRQEVDLHPQTLFDTLVAFHERVPSVKAFETLEEDSRPQQYTQLRPNVQTFSMLIDGAASFTHSTKQARVEGAATATKPFLDDGVLVADRMLRWMIDEAEKYPHVRPNVITFSSLMNAWVKSKRSEGPERVEELLDKMQDLHMDHPEWDVAPNQFTYATAIDAWAKAGNADRAEELLRDMHAEYQAGATELQPNLHAFNGYLVALARAGRIQEAETLLQDMEHLYATGHLDEQPNIISYSTLLDACAKSWEEGAAERSETIIRRMKDQGLPVNTISWNTVINAHVRHRKMERAETLLREMNDDYSKGNRDVKPTMRTYSIVLSGWSRTKDPKAGERGEQLLELMKGLSEAGELEEVDLIAYNSVLNCWAKSRSKHSAARSKKFLEKMVHEDGMEPDMYSYNIVMSALIRQGSLKEAESMFDLMIQKGVQPDATAYNTILNAWIKSRSKDAPRRVRKLYTRLKEDPNVDPDLFTMNMLLSFYSRTGNPEAAEALLEEMSSSDSQVKPDEISFNTALAAWTRSRQPNAPEKGEAILERMLDLASNNVRPNVITFNSLLNAWVKSRRPEAITNCQRLVGMMHEMVATGENYTVQPDAVTYNTLIQAHALANDIDAQSEADKIFQEMHRRYKAGESRLKPTVHTYGSLINGWSRIAQLEAVQKADETLRLWVERASNGDVEGRPRVFEFTSVLNALIRTQKDDPLAIFRADELLHLLLQEYNTRGNVDAKPDARFLSLILKLLASSSVPHKARTARKVVQLMMEHEIHPNPFIMNNLKTCLEH